MYFHAPYGVVLYSVLLCVYIVECNCNIYEHKKIDLLIIQEPSKSDLMRITIVYLTQSNRILAEMGKLA